MTTATTKQSRLTDEQLQDMLALVKGADSVELKLTVPESDQRSAIAALGMDPLEAQIRQVYFFDTPDLALNRHGVVPRARRVQGKGDDSVVKLRPVVPHELPAGVRRSPNVGVEVDAMPGGYVCSASMKAVPADDVRQVTLAGGSIRKLFSKEQRAFFTAHAPEGLTLDDLSILGPINVFKLKFKPEGFERRMVAELWMYPNDTRILELSTKCLPAEALQVAFEARMFLTKRGIDLMGEQQTKTKTALEYFSRNLVAKS
ncbi:MAG: adenylate cyclase [Actinomycetota bacterium]